MRASVSASSHWLSAATPPAAREVPITTQVIFSGLYTGRAAK
jgi:hypothetical protein